MTERLDPHDEQPTPGPFSAILGFRFIGVDDVVKIKEIHDFHFELMNITVKDERGKKLGKVTDYTIEPGSFLIKQLNVRRPMLKSLSDTELLIDRTQIVEVSNDTITIKNDEREGAPAAHAAKVYTNPFRSVTPQPEPIKRD